VSNSTQKEPSVNARTLIQEAIAGRDLLSHPFYRRWQAGELEPSELTAYAAQYRHFEAQLPQFLREVLAGAAEGKAADLLADNLRDETSRPAPHLGLFDAFAAAVGADVAAVATPATAALVRQYERYASATTAEAVAALAAYEVQAATVATSKAAGLRESYGLDGEATTFWEVHAAADVEHADWVLQSLDELLAGAGEEARRTAGAAAGSVAAAWWAFLDEREAARPLVA
jgi:pyrroloquinoline-quinone synthase